MFKGRCGKKNYKFIYVLRSIFPCIIFSSTLFVIPTTLIGFTTLFSKLLEHFGVRSRARWPCCGVCLLACIITLSRFNTLAVGFFTLLNFFHVCMALPVFVWRCDDDLHLMDMIVRRVFLFMFVICEYAF